jgi:hypothetical protein
MEAAIATILSFLGIGGVPGEKSLARADFGGHWGLVIALNVVNTAIVVFYVWRIWRQKLPPIR